jgi:hypothetical protein
VDGLLMHALPDAATSAGSCNLSTRNAALAVLASGLLCSASPMHKHRSNSTSQMKVATSIAFRQHVNPQDGVAQCVQVHGRWAL